MIRASCHRFGENINITKFHAGYLSPTGLLVRVAWCHFSACGGLPYTCNKLKLTDNVTVKSPEVIGFLNSEKKRIEFGRMDAAWQEKTQ